MRRFIVPALAVLLGASIVPVVQRSVIIGWPTSPHGVAGPGAANPSPPPAAPNTPPDPHAEALKLLRGSYFREAQDSFLKILAFNPDDEVALAGLVVVRQSLAGNDPKVLRQQAADYREAIKRGVDTKEHYSRSAMEQLMVASVQAARQIEARTPGFKIPPSAHLAEDKELAGGRSLPSISVPGKPTAPQAPPSAGAKLPPASARAAKPTPRTPPSSGGKLPPASSPAVKPAGPQAPAPAAAPAQKGPGVPPTSLAVQTLAPPPARPTPQTPPPSAAPVQRGAEMPPTSPALQTPSPSSDKPTTLPAPPSSTATAQRGAEVPPTSPALQTAPATADKRLYTVRVGPISDRDRASAIARQLSASGFAQTKITTRTAFRVVSEPLPRSAAENLVTALAGRGVRSQVEPLTRDTVQLLFGSFTSQKDAEALSRRIAAAGYEAWIREGTSYTLQIGPYPQSSVNTIMGIVQSGAPDERITADPVP